MINSITPEQTIAPNADRTSRSQGVAEESIGRAPQQQKQSPVSSEVKVDDAKLRYRMETRQSQEKQSTITDINQARETLGWIIQQITEQPDRAMHMHGNSTPGLLLNLLNGAAA